MSVSLSKSQARALSCELYFCGHFVDHAPQVSQSFTRTGSDFHRFAAEYTDHLVAAGLESDPAWATGWLSTIYVEDDARDMIERELPFIRINPDKVYGTEVFVALDEDFQRVQIDSPGVGKSPAGAYVHGTLDIVEIDGSVIYVDDYKTGFLTKVDPYEAVHYAVLGFALYPGAERLRWRWRFIRAGAPKEEWFERANLDRLHSIVRAKVAQRNELEVRYMEGGKIAVNPLSGMCSYCNLICPIRAAALAGQYIQAPIQTEQDAASALGNLIAIRTMEGNIEESLRLYLDNNAPVTAGSFTAAMEAKSTMSIPLDQGLALLSIPTPEISPAWDVPLSALRIGVTEFKRLAKAKKRAGLMEGLELIADRKPRSELVVKRAEISAEITAPAAEITELNTTTR